jgi:hypothetical protein
MALDLKKSAVGDGASGRAVEKPPKDPKLWKRFLITIVGAYPLTVVIPLRFSDRLPL